MWFRIELDKTGAVLSCEQVESSASNGKHVRYVEADDKTKALVLVAAWYKQSEYARSRRIAIRTSRERHGLCVQCGDPLTDGRCETCREKRRAQAQRYVSGEFKPRPFAPATNDDERAAAIERKIARDNTKKKRNGDSRRRVLEKLFEVKRVHARSTRAEFEKWLASQLELYGASVAKLKAGS